MQIIVILIIVIIFIANQVEKNKKNNPKIGTKSTHNITPQPNNSYQVNQSNKRNSEKAFRESTSYQTSHMVNEQRANREAVVEVMSEFNESPAKKKAKKTKKTTTSSKPVTNKKETTVEYVDLAKSIESAPVKDTDYVWSIFDDFAASDALYLARKDVESRKTQKISYI